MDCECSSGLGSHAWPVLLSLWGGLWDWTAESCKRRGEEGSGVGGTKETDGEGKEGGSRG